jgi:hypothetical protein
VCTGVLDRIRGRVSRSEHPQLHDVGAAADSDSGVVEFHSFADNEVARLVWDRIDRSAGVRACIVCGAVRGSRAVDLLTREGTRTVYSAQLVEAALRASPPCAFASAALVQFRCGALEPVVGGRSLRGGSATRSLFLGTADDRSFAEFRLASRAGSSRRPPLGRPDGDGDRGGSGGERARGALGSAELGHEAQDERSGKVAAGERLRVAACLLAQPLVAPPQCQSKRGEPCSPLPISPRTLEGGA